MEQWLPVVGYEGLYEVSDMGRVRSLDRAVWRDDARCRPHYVTYRGREMRLSRQAHGYVGVILWRDGKYRNVRVHRLVLEAFVGPCPRGMETLHGNGQRNDNRLANLRWGTQEENAEDRVRHGTLTRRSA